MFAVAGLSKVALGGSVFMEENPSLLKNAGSLKQLIVVVWTTSSSK